MSRKKMNILTDVAVKGIEEEMELKALNVTLLSEISGVGPAIIGRALNHGECASDNWDKITVALSRQPTIPPIEELAEMVRVKKEEKSATNLDLAAEIGCAPSTVSTLLKNPEEIGVVARRAFGLWLVGLQDRRGPQKGNGAMPATEAPIGKAAPSSSLARAIEYLRMKKELDKLYASFTKEERELLGQLE